jgi:hypothetical protein
MTQTALGIIYRGDGLASSERDYWASPAEEVARRQDPLYVDVEHSGVPVGRVEWLERTGSGDDAALWAVASVDDSVREVTFVRVGEEFVPVSTPLYFSASRLRGENLTRDIHLLSLSVTAHPASLGATPIKIFPGRCDSDIYWRSRNVESGITRELLTRAGANYWRRRSGDGLLVHEERSPYGRYEGGFREGEHLPGPWRYRKGKILGVR